MNRLFPIALLVLASSTAAIAAPITVPPGGTWQAVPTPDQNGAPFWDNTSWDGSNQNVGFKLQALLGAAYASLEYMTPQSFVIGGTGQDVQLKVEVAGNRDANALYFNNGGADTQLFSGLAGPGASYAGTISGPFSFVLYPNGQAGQAFSTSSDTSFNQFALFRLQGTQQYFLGIEDLPLQGSDRDYNDMIVSFELQAVPEPASVMLLGLGLLAAGRGMRRRA